MILHTGTSGCALASIGVVFEDEGMENKKKHNNKSRLVLVAATQAIRGAVFKDEGMEKKK